MDSLFQTLTGIPLIEVSFVEACGVQSDCILRRTKDKLPAILETSGGFVIKNVSSLDTSESIIPSTAMALARKIKIGDKHAKNVPVFFIKNGYMYFYNIAWDYVQIEAIFEEPEKIELLNACKTTPDSCDPIYVKSFPLPNYLHKPLKDILNNSLLQYYHRFKEDTQVDKMPTE